MTKKYNYMLRTCNADMTSYNGFKWPEKGHIEAPDWKPNSECGNGLHGLLDGVGNASLLSTSSDAKWLICRFDGKYIDLCGKIKVQKCEVIFCGKKEMAINKIQKLVPPNTPIVFSNIEQGDESTATQGDLSTATQGDESTATQGNWSTAITYGGTTYIVKNGKNCVLIQFYDGKKYISDLDILLKDFKIGEKVKIVKGEVTK